MTELSLVAVFRGWSTDHRRPCADCWKKNYFHNACIYIFVLHSLTEKVLILVRNVCEETVNIINFMTFWPLKTFCVLLLCFLKRKTCVKHFCMLTCDGQLKAELWYTELWSQTGCFSMKHHFYWKEWQIDSLGYGQTFFSEMKGNCLFKGKQLTILVAKDTSSSLE